jgi:Uma2 family endonuclease
MPIYAREGVSYLWLVHPGLQTLEVYRLEGSHWVVASSHVGSESIRAEPFEAIELDMSRWWLEGA